jgi:hypothetical protein
VTVCDPRHNKLIEDGNKSDALTVWQRREEFDVKKAFAQD